jgi:hypothetical protein
MVEILMTPQMVVALHGHSDRIRNLKLSTLFLKLPCLARLVALR